jgi:hypothetical protein
MKHRRGIDLVPANDECGDQLFEANELAWLNIDKLREWHVLGGKCTRCLRKGWVDRREIERDYGRFVFLAFLRPYLRCRRCNNKGDNKWIIGTMAR